MYLPSIQLLLSRSEYELSVLPVSVTELLSNRTFCHTTVNAPGYELSLCVKVALSLICLSVLNQLLHLIVNCQPNHHLPKYPRLNGLSVLPLSIKLTRKFPEPVCHSSKLAFAPLTPPVLSQKTINASHVFHVNSYIQYIQIKLR